MIHITGSLQETALLDVRAIDTKLAKWMAKKVWLEVQGVTGWEGLHRTRWRGRDFGGSSSCLDIAFLHSLAEVARGQGVFSLLSRGLMLTARGNKPVTSQGEAKSARVQRHSATPAAGNWNLAFATGLSLLRLALSPGLQRTKWKDAPHCGCPGIQMIFAADNTLRLRFTH